MDLPEIWRDAIIQWAENQAAIREIWLFGSRATRAAPESDVDLAIVLAPPTGKTDWALGLYLAYGDNWQRQLRELLGRHVSLEAFEPESDAGRLEVMQNGHCLWRRVM